MELAIAVAGSSFVVIGLRCRTTGSASVAWRVTSTARLCRRTMASRRAARLMVSQTSFSSIETLLFTYIHLLEVTCSPHLSGLEDAEADFFSLSPGGICSRLQDMQRKGCSRMPRVQGTHSYYHGYAAVDFPFDVSDIAQNGIG